MADEEMAGLFRRQMEGALSYQREACRDYTDCVKEKAIADAACKTWEQTVERLVCITFLYGHMVGGASSGCPDMLTDAERNDLRPSHLPK